MHTRREFMKRAGETYLAASLAPLASTFASIDLPGRSGSMRCINVVNFIRGVEPRFETDLLLPVQKQMELILQHRLPATWLLQFDALVAGPFVEFLKAHMAKDHEVGFWFEMNEMLVKEAGVEWRGRPGYEWDHLPPVAFTIGYSPEERIKLADAAMSRFKSIWGKYPSSVASWNLDAITMLHLTEKYGIDAYAVCRDQIATDGFTIWGAPIAGYYPSKVNCWSPALDRHNQINTPVFRMLGQDPVYYYYNRFRLRGREGSPPVTMEPTWITGQTPVFVDKFLEMISRAPCLNFAYAQLGQENSFPWSGTAAGYSLQMNALAVLRDKGSVHVETMGESGRRFKKAFTMTPAQSQVMRSDPFANFDPAEATVWYQSRFYRANLHLKGKLPFFRDLTVYSDEISQPFLTKATRQNDVEQRMLAVLDGYHWSAKHGLGEPGAGGFFEVGGKRVTMSSLPRVWEEGSELAADLPIKSGTIHVLFSEREISIKCDSDFSIAFTWDSSKSPLPEVQPRLVRFGPRESHATVRLGRGIARSDANGWTAVAERGEIVLKLAQGR